MPLAASVQPRRLAAFTGAAAVVATVCLAAFALQVALPAAAQLTNGFAAYYTAARVLRSGGDAARFYDDQWFQFQTIGLGFGNARDIFNVNPPTAALLLWPLAGLATGDAKAAWTILNLLFVASALFLLARLGRVGFSAAALGLAAVTLYQPLREEIRLGQAYALLLLVEAAFAWAYLGKRWNWAGSALGLMIGFKTAGLALPGLFIAQRQWRALVATALSIGVIVALTLPVVGVVAWSTYVRLLSEVDAHPELAVTAYQSLPGLTLHLFRQDPMWNPRPLIDAPLVGTAFLVVAALALVGITLRATWPAARTNSMNEVTSPPAATTGVPAARPENPLCRSSALAAWAILSVVLSPAASDYHYTLLLVPIALLLFAWRDSGFDPGRGLGIAVGALLVGAPLPYQSPALTAGFWALLAYPKLYGALVLWAVASVSPERPSVLPNRSIDFSWCQGDAR